MIAQLADAGSSQDEERLRKENEGLKQKVAELEVCKFLSEIFE